VPANWQTALTRKSQPSGLSRWRRITSIPIAALGTPITAAITPLSTWCDSTHSGIAAAKDSTAALASASAQARGDPSRTRRRPAAVTASVGSVITSPWLTNRTLRADRSGNVTAAS
jgi:hypothetical protein